ncbi:glycosyltransferase family A protein [Paenibacillus sp. Y412MC10]|uniref:glycosyltransferase family 2 protein n=1 Tax=Geobacillus sp. (strain Y412MC10) TaxID=481743 RepID=UPI0011AB5DF4|nr:glycosyltransferase family A protein [Paenibacillus sp. Y412MC10]
MVKVSFILTVYNGEEMLSDAIESVLIQSFPDFELIATDDGSTDNTFAILEHYAKTDRRIIALQNTSNIGVANSLNRAIQHSTGQYIARIDHDDINIGTRLEQQIGFLDDNPDVGVVSCFVDPLFNLETDSETRKGVIEFERRRRELARDPEKIKMALRQSNVFHHGEVVYRKSLWDRVGGYRPELSMAEDYDLWLRLSTYTNFHIIPQTLYLRRFNNANTTQIYSNMMWFATKLAQECFELREYGKQSDDEYARKQFLSYINDDEGLKHFSKYLEGGLVD